MNRLNDVIQYSQEMSLLYVEDNPDAREMTSMILQEFFGHVVTAADGEEGLTLFGEHAIDIVLTDINLPKLSGLEMLREIRKIDQQVSMVVLSAYNDASYMEESIAIGVDGYLKKPIDVDAFFDLVSRIVQKYRFDNEMKMRMDFLEAHQQATELNALISKTDPNGVITYVNDAFCAVSGYSREELIGQNHNIVRHPDNPSEIFEEMWDTIKKHKQVWRGVVRNRAKNGKSYYVDSLIMPVLDLDGNVVEYISPRNDITDIMQPSRQLQNALKQFQEQALLYLKLKHYEMLEEFYDDAMMERIQEKIALFLQAQCSRLYSFDRIYSLGNGEYALLVSPPDHSGDADVEHFVTQLREFQRQSEEEVVEIDGIKVRASFRISVVYENDRILESAKLGLKQMLLNHTSFIIANGLAIKEKSRTEANMKMVDTIQTAISDSRVVACFQPIIDNQTRRIVKYESLVRLADGGDELIAPWAFLDVSKKCGCYPQITEKVIHNSFEILQQTDADISINLSVADIEHRPTRTMILDFLETNKADAGRIVFELLEDEMTQDYDRIHAFATQVKAYGVRIAIDDFGAGYSNYERLLSYRPDILKIDGSLIRAIDKDNYTHSIVKSIVTFAKEQNLEIVAEFVESEAVFARVKELGIEYSQGYLFGKPERFCHSPE